MRRMLRVGDVRARWVLPCLAISCSSPEGEATNVGGGGDWHDGGAEANGEGFPCTPKTCEELGADCGELVEPCGAVLSCGQCDDGETCGAVTPNRCGTGSCVPKTCNQLGAACGLIGDGCSSVLQCGTCPNDEVCGASQPNQCGLCTPDCAGKQCGPDGCGSECTPGCGSGEQCTASGVCESTCPTTWQATHGSELQEIALHQGKLFAAGSKASEGWIVALSPCDGSLEMSGVVGVAGSSRLMSLAPSGAALLVAGDAQVGTDPRDVLVARVSAATLAIEWAELLHGSDETDEGWGIGAATDGFVWVGGKVLKESGTKPWGAKVDPSGTPACGFQFGQNGHVRTALAGPLGVYMAGQFDDNASIVRFDTGSCSTVGPCECAPDWQATPLEWGSHTEYRALELVGDSLYAGGFALQSGTDYKAIVVRVNTDTGEIVKTWEWNPTGLLDAVHGLASDGQRLYAALSINTTPGLWAGSQAVVAALPLDLDPLATPTWTSPLPAMNVAMDVAIDSSDNGLYVVGHTVDEGWAARCTKNGVCPP